MPKRALPAGARHLVWVAVLAAAAFATGVVLAQLARYADPSATWVLFAVALALRVRLAARSGPLTLILDGLALLGFVALADGWAYVPPYYQVLPPAGAAGGILASFALGVVGGRRMALVALPALVLARLGGAFTGIPYIVAEIPLTLMGIASVSTLAALLGGFFGRLLRRTERSAAVSREREQTARRLHDGVLQTLALVEREAPTEKIGQLARAQSRELRAFLFATPVEQTGPFDLAGGLRAAASRFELAYGTKVDVVVASDVPLVDQCRGELLLGAVAEALTNAGRHGRAPHVVIYAEPDDSGGLTCFVRDDGAGFDTTITPLGAGLRSSVTGRMADAGGSAQVTSRPGAGTEVCLRIPSVTRL